MQAPVILGLDFGGTKIAAAVCETSGARLGTRTIDALADLGAASGLRRGIEAARALVDERSQIPEGRRCNKARSTAPDGAAIAVPLPRTPHLRAPIPYDSEASRLSAVTPAPRQRGAGGARSPCSRRPDAPTRPECRAARSRATCGKRRSSPPAQGPPRRPNL